MELTLILSESLSSSDSTQQIWQDACVNQNIVLNVLDLNNENGQILARQLNLKSFPALVFNNNVTAVGHPDKQTAEKIIANLLTSQ
jgi:hypothetical protein